MRSWEDVGLAEEYRDRVSVSRVVECQGDSSVSSIEEE